MTYEEAMVWACAHEAAIEAAARAGDPTARVVTYRMTEARRVATAVVRERLIDAVAAYRATHAEEGATMSDEQKAFTAEQAQNMRELLLKKAVEEGIVGPALEAFKASLDKTWPRLREGGCDD